MASRFTPDQIAGVVAAQLDGGLTADEAAAAALAGELDGLEPFAISASTARSHAAETRRRARVEHPIGDEILHAGDAQVRRLSELIEKALEAEEAKPPDKVDVDRLRQLGKAAVAVAQAAREVRRPVPGRRTPHGSATAESAGDAADVDWLAAVAAKSGNGDRA